MAIGIAIDYRVCLYDIMLKIVLRPKEKWSDITI